MKKILFALAVVAMAAGCAMVNEGGVPSGKNLIRVSSDEATRTEIVTDDDVTFRHNWVKGDAIALFDARDILKYELVGEGGSTTADFSGEEPTKQQAPYYAIYPYRDNIDIYNDATHQSKFLYEFPSEMEYDGKTMVGSNVMIGFTDSKSLTMKNACSYIRISLSSPFLSFLDEIEIIARGGENIAGPHLIGIDGAGVPFTEFFAAGGSDVAGTTGPLKEDYSRVIVKFPESKFLTANTDMFYIPLPPVELSEGLAFVLKGDFGGEPTLNLTCSTATLERNTVLVMEEYRLPSEEARIGDVIYETIDEAFAAANASNEPCTITLLRTCMAGARLPLNDAGTGDVTLDLKGKTLMMPNQIRVTGRKLTITDSFSTEPDQQGTITTTYSGGRAIYVENADAVCIVKAGNIISTAAQGMWTNGTIIMEGNSTLTSNGSGIYLNGPEATLVVKDNVKITSATSNAIYLNNAKQADIGDNVTIKNSGAATLYVVKGTMNITGGNFSRSNSGNGYIVYTEGADAVVNVSGGWFDNFGATSATSCVTATSSGGTVNVSGGYFNSYGINPVTSTDPGVAVVTGGYFNKGIQPRYAGSLVNVLNEDPATCETYPFTVAEGDVVAITTQSSYSWNCGSIECAFKSANQRALANGNTTATLQKDAAAASTLEVVSGNSYGITVDLNGHTISSTANPAVKTASNFTLMDSGTEGDLVTSGSVGMEITAGNTVINGASLYGTSNAVNITGGTLSVNDGYICGGGTADIVKSGSASVTLAGGWYAHEPNAGDIIDGCGAKAEYLSHNGRSFGYHIIATKASVKVNGEGFATWAAAIAAAASYSGDDATVTIQLQEDISEAAQFTTLHATKPVVLDLNGYVLSTTVDNFIAVTSGTLTITDSKNKVGKITSSTHTVVFPGSSSVVNITNCIIESTLAEASGYDDQPVMLFGGSSVTTITDAWIYSCGKQTVLRLNNSNCKVTVNGDTEITAGKVNGDGLNGVLVKNGTFTFNSGSVYKRGETTQPAIGSFSNSGSITIINGGYFYSEASNNRTLRKAQTSSMTINAGYMNNKPSSGGSPAISYGGKSVKELSTPATHLHKTTNTTLSYKYSVE